MAKTVNIRLSREQLKFLKTEWSDMVHDAYDADEDQLEMAESILNVLQAASTKERILRNAKGEIVAYYNPDSSDG